MPPPWANTKQGTENGILEVCVCKCTPPPSLSLSIMYIFACLCISSCTCAYIGVDLVLMPSGLCVCLCAVLFLCLALNKHQPHTHAQTCASKPLKLRSSSGISCSRAHVLLTRAHSSDHPPLIGFSQHTLAAQMSSSNCTNV